MAVVDGHRVNSGGQVSNDVALPGLEEDLSDCDAGWNRFGALEVGVVVRSELGNIMQLRGYKLPKIAVGTERKNTLEALQRPWKSRHDLATVQYTR